MAVGDAVVVAARNVDPMSAISPQVPIRPSDRPSRGDRIFRGFTVGAAMLALVTVVVAILFLANEARPALSSTGLKNFFTSTIWNGFIGQFGILGVMVGTMIIATIAMIVAVPAALSMALFINEYAPRKVGRLLTSVVDLLAALPSLIFGMWGRDAFQQKLVPVARWLSDHLYAIPFFRLSAEDVVLVRSSFVVGVIVGIMVIPIITSISRDVMAQAPRDVCEAALGLGGTRWGMIRTVILPFGRSGIVGGILLAFGRALGETIAVALIIQLTFDINWHVLEAGGSSVAGLIAVRFGEATPLERSGLIAAGFALLVLTFTVNLIARRIVKRGQIK